MRVTQADLHDTAKVALAAHGAADWIAASVADAVTEAEATGNRICGLYYLESYCLQLVSGRVKGDAEPVVTRPRPGEVNVDGRMGFAQPAFARGLAPALEAARECGVARLSVGHTHTCTAVGFFTAQVARAGVICLGMTNASPVVAPPGGRTRVIGTNPVAFSVPDGKGGVAMQFDQSTTVVALGAITMAKAAGRAIPEGWAVDADGRPTTDPDAALAGAMLPFGGHKGSAISTMIELLAGVMIGDLTSPEALDLMGGTHLLPRHGDLILAFDPARFAAGRPGDPLARAEMLFDRILGQGARLPSQRRFKARAEAEAHGITLTTDEMSRLDRLQAGGLDAVD